MNRILYAAAIAFFCGMTSHSLAAEPNWIWSTKNANTSAAAGDVYFRRTFTAEAPSKGSIEITADNRYEVFVNGRNIGSGAEWQKRTKFDIGAVLVPGRNVIAVHATNDGEDPAGLVAKIVIEQKDKPAIELVTAAEWKFTSKPLGNWARLEFDDSQWQSATVLGVYGKTQPWGAAGSVQAPQQAAVANKPRAREKGFFDFKDGDRVVFLGSAFFERMQQHGYLETMITAGLPDRNITFRNLGWSGDNVWGDARGVFGGRAEGFKRLLSDVNLCNPTVIIVCYGENEAYDGEAGIDSFRDGLKKLLDALEATGACLLLLSPRQHESLGYPLPDATEYNESLKLYRDVIGETAKIREHAFIDLYEFGRRPDGDLHRWTDNGIHLTVAGERQLAMQLLPYLGVPKVDVRIEIDIARPTIDVVGAQVVDLKVNGDRVSFSAIWRSAVADYDHLRPSIRERCFTIKGLPKKSYQCYFDGVADGKPLTGSDFSQGLSFPSGAERSEQLRQKIAEKNTLFFNRHRPQNETYLFLFRKHEQGNNAVEIPQFDPLIAEKEKEIAELRKPVVHKFELKLVE